MYLSVKAVCRSALDVLHRVSHGVHQVVEVVDGFSGLVTELILGPCVVGNFGQEIHAAGMYHDTEVLDVLDAAADGVWAFARRADAAKTLFPQLIEALWLSAP